MSIYQHFRPEERDFIDQMLNWKEYVEQSYAPKLIDFLDPREQQILKTIIGGHSGISLGFFGGADEKNERKRALLYPDYFQYTEEDFQIRLFEIDYAKKFINLTHRQVLGSLMGLGLKREKFGDIILIDNRVQFYCAGEVSEYIRLEFHSAGKANVQLIEMPLSEGLIVKEEWTEQTVIVSSLRLDTIISALFQISRQKSQAYISSGLVKVNWTKIENNSFECGEGDTLSVRGYGRAKVFSIEGKTKKDKWRLSAGRQK